MNEWQKSRFSEGVIGALFNTVTDKQIALLGFAFKKNTGDTRESPAIHVASHLLAEGAHLHIFDPQVEPQQVRAELEAATLDAALVARNVVLHPDAYAATGHAHAIVLCTEWDEFLELDFGRIYAGMTKPAWVFDGRKMLDHEMLRRLGFHVHTIGKRLSDATPPAPWRCLNHQA